LTQLSESIAFLLVSLLAICNMRIDFPTDPSPVLGIAVNSQSPSQLKLEPLEFRENLAVTASVVNGILEVAGSATTAGNTISVIVNTSNQVRVLDGTVQVGPTVTNPATIRVQTGDTADKVRVNFSSSNSLPPTYNGRVLVYTNGGNDEVTVVNGGARSLNLSSGDGDDRITLSNIRTTERIAVDAGTGTDFVDAAATGFGIFVGTNALIRNAEVVASGISTGGDLSLINSSDKLDATVSTFPGVIAGNLNFSARGGGVNFFRGRVVGEVSIQPTVSPISELYFTMRQRAQVGSVSFTGTDKNDRILVSGIVDRDFSVLTRVGNDTVQLGDPNDLAESPTQAINGAAIVDLGDGDDTFNFAPFGMPFSITNLVVNGGPGTDTFIGNRTQTGVLLISI
jgi:hypothetical protein